MNKTVVAPIIAFLILAVKVIFKIDIPDDVSAHITDYIVTGASLAGVVYGIITNHKK